MHKTLLTNSFVMRFTKAVNKLYNYPKYMDYVVVPSVLGTKTLSYLPLLNYTDRRSDNIEDLLELAKDNEYQIRALNFEYTNFKTDDTVTMRVSVEDKTSEEFFAQDVKSRCRNKVRNAFKKFDFSMRHGNASQDIEDFYTIFSSTMYKHGTPLLDKKIFYNLVEEFEENIIFFNLYEGIDVIATMCILLDEDIAWYPWGGVRSEYNSKLAGYQIYWETLKHICDNTQSKIFDFGRSSYGGSTYKFKSQFGANPVKIDIHSSQNIDIYARYSLASDIWKKLPKKLVDFIGPKLCKYLVDL